jgi:hypothetical protein
VALVSISCSFHHFDSNLVFTYKSQWLPTHFSYQVYAQDHHKTTGKQVA